MYGSTEEEKEPSSIEGVPLVKVSSGGESSVPPSGEEVSSFLRNPFQEDFSDNAFWDQISILYDDGKELSWSEAMNRVRLKHIKKKFEVNSKDPLEGLICDVYDKFLSYANDPQVMSSFKQQLAQFVNLILHEDFDDNLPDDRKYFWPIEIENGGKKTILHLAAERNLTEIAEIFIQLYPGHVYEPTTGCGKQRLPLELSLLKRYDDVSSYLIKHMLHERVRDLFQSNDTFSARFRFADIINDPEMKQTVIAILDCCVNADWPYVPVKSGERKEEAWSKIPDMPLRYHFFYRLLDGDQQSEPAKIKDEMNGEFDHLSPSCLQLIADSPHSQEAISHPVIRMLVNRKWDLYGCMQIRIHFAVYVLYIMLMGLAFFIDGKFAGLSKYNKNREEEMTRLVFEILTLLFTLVYCVLEIDQMEKEKSRYWYDPYNYFDLIGLAAVICLVPLRFVEATEAEFSLAAIAFLFNCLRVFKFFPAFKQLGLYSKTFAHIIYYDITKFAVVYIIVMVAFTGAMYLSMKASLVGQTTIATVSFWDIFLRETRALTEGNPFDDSYETYNSGVIVLIMINMFSIIVILSNILIGQLSWRYANAVEEAEIQYSIDKAKFITRLEKSRFRTWNTRMKHYVEGDYISDDNLVVGLLQDWNILQETKTMNSKAAIKSMMEKVLRTNEKHN